MSILSKLDRIPPCVCRLLARRRQGRVWVGLSHREIQERSQLPKSTIGDLSFRKSWKGVPVEVVDAFSAACGVDHLRARKQLYYLNNRELSHTKNGSHSQVLMYTNLMELYAEIREAQKR